MLFDLTKNLSLIEADDLKSTEEYQAFERKNSQVTIDAVFRKFNKFIEDQKPSQCSQLTWVRLAKMFGRGSLTPHRDLCYIEDVILKTVGDGKSFLILSGILMMMTIANRPEEHWLTDKTAEEEKFDHETGKAIEWRAYWINKNFQIPARYKKYAVQDVVQRFNRARI